MDFIDPKNLQFWLYDWLCADALTSHPAYADHSRETFDAILELSAKLAADKFATHYKKSDRIEPSLENGVVRVIPEIKQALADYAEAGLFSASFDPRHGGLGLPHVIDTASMANFMAGQYRDRRLSDAGRRQCARAGKVRHPGADRNFRPA